MWAYCMCMLVARQNQYVLYNDVYFGAVADMQIYVKLRVCGCVAVQPAWPSRRTLHKCASQVRNKRAEP